MVQNKKRHAMACLNNNKIDTLDYTEEITKLYFIRHGQTRANKERLLFGHLDIDLDETGIKQANSLAKKLNLEADLIISSPLKRAYHTAKFISTKIGIKKILLDKDLMERSEGDWEGKTFWDVRKNENKNYMYWLKDPFNHKPPKGESVTDLDKRVKRFYKKILTKYKGKTIIIVTHSGPIRLFILNVLEASIKKFWHLKIDCCSVTEVNISKKHSMIISVNRN